MAQETPIVDEPEVNPVTNTVMVPFTEDAPLVEPEPIPEPEATPEPIAEPVDPFASDTAPEPTLSQKESQELRTQRAEIERERAELEKEKSDIQQSRAKQDRLSRYTAQHGEEAAREMIRDQTEDQAAHDTEVNQLRSTQRFNEEKQRSVTELSEQYKVDPKYLAKFDSRTSMEAGAIERAARIQDKVDSQKIQEGFEKRLSVIEEAKIEDGAFDSAAAGSTPLSGKALADAAVDIDFYEKMTPKMKEDLNAFLKV